MEDTKILTITGMNGSGKTTIAFKIAKELENLGNNVCIVNFDGFQSLSTIKNNYNNYNVSIAYILTKEIEATQKDVYSAMIPITDNISTISYIYGDTKDKYSRILNNRVRDFIELLSGIVDYIIIDTTNNIIEPENRQSIQMANKIINIIEPTYKGLAYHKTFNTLLDRIDIDNSSIFTLVNKVFYDTDYKKYCLEMNLRYYQELPFVLDIIKNSNDLFKYNNNRTHEEQKFNRLFKLLMREIYKIDYDQELLESKIDIKQKQKVVYKSQTADDIERKIQKMRKENKTVKVASEKPKKGLFFNLFDKPKSNKGYDYDDDGGEF